MSILSGNEKSNILGGILTGTAFLFAILPNFTEGLIWATDPLSTISRFLAVTAISFLGSSMIMNKGDKWIFNIFAQKEPLSFALGLGLLSIYITLPIPINWVTASLGAVLITFSLIARYTELTDL